MGGMSKLPLVAHEQANVDWPVADYFGQALTLTRFQPSARTSALTVRPSSMSSATHVVLPVQTQAFGFAPAFRAVIGAELDQRLEAAGLDSTRQTDIVDAYGPYARRLDAATVESFTREHAGKKVVALYIGHDGFSQTFVTLVLHEGERRRVAHRAVALAPDASTAVEALSPVLAELVSALGLRSSAKPPAADTTARGCPQTTWTLEPPGRHTARSARACHALAVGALLPQYETASPDGVSEAQSPARLAWLAQAYVSASGSSLPASTATAIRHLAWTQMGLRNDKPAPPRPDDDPVVSRLLRFNELRENTQRAPVRSTQEALARATDNLTKDLPAFARSVFRARLDAGEPFSSIDLCSIERVLPQTMTRPVCRTEERSEAPARAAWPAEILLYQEWRLMSHYKNVTLAGLTQGSRQRTQAILASWPADVAEHPYLVRARYVVGSRFPPSGDFNPLLEAGRADARRVTQSTVDLQRADRWLSGHSLNGHAWTNNLNVMNDPQVQEVTGDEMRLLAVLRFDKYTLDRYVAQRKSGDPAFFLAPKELLRFAAGPFTGLATSAEPSQLPPEIAARLQRPRLFPPQFLTPPATDDEWRAALQRSPLHLSARTQLALGGLKDGGTLADALALIDAQPDDQRQDNRVGQSHLWAEPAHYFYFAGELAPAKKYYRKTADIGTGSESDLMARIRLKLLDGQMREALDATIRRSERYESDYARRDRAGLLFMLGQHEAGWDVFMPHAVSSKLFPLWVGAYVGHRKEGLDLAGVDRWLADNKLDSVQINFKDAGFLYLHLYATMDRLPTEADVQRLGQPRGGSKYATPLWSASARLVRAAMSDSGHANAHQQAKAALKDRSDPSLSFMQPLYTWNAWLGTDGKDPYLDEAREATTRSSFDDVLSKAMLLALEGDSSQSLRLFNAARYELAATSNRLVPGLYTWSLAGWLMHRKTGEDRYRVETLRFAKSQQKVFPYLGWLYGLEALLDTDPQTRHAAACRANHLDPSSFFLGQAKVRDVNTAACQRHVASLLR